MLKADLRGFTKEDVDVDIQGNRLILRGERKRETEAQEEQYRIEHTYGRFERAFWLPTIVASEKIQATFKDGVRELRLPRMDGCFHNNLVIAHAIHLAA